MQTRSGGESLRTAERKFWRCVGSDEPPRLLVLSRPSPVTKFDDLSTIIADALAWERTLAQSQSKPAKEATNRK